MKRKRNRVEIIVDRFRGWKSTNCDALVKRFRCSLLSLNILRIRKLDFQVEDERDFR